MKGPRLERSNRASNSRAWISSSGCMGQPPLASRTKSLLCSATLIDQRSSQPSRRADVVQLRMMADIVAFDLTHVYLALDVLSSQEEEDAGQLSALAPKKPAILRFTLPECHVFLRALREFHGLIEVTTPVLEEAKRLKARNGAPANGRH